MANFFLLGVFDAGRGAMAAYVDTSEVVMALLHVAVCQRIYLNERTAHRRGITVRQALSGWISMYLRRQLRLHITFLIAAALPSLVLLAVIMGGVF